MPSTVVRLLRTVPAILRGPCAMPAIHCGPPLVMPHFAAAPPPPTPPFPRRIAAPLPVPLLRLLALRG
eukprot:11632494-Prorocentrum_lima.AAC.1